MESVGVLSKKPSELWVDEYEILAVNCYVPIDFREAFPVYIVETEHYYVVLFRQWLYDPHTTSIADELFDQWPNKDGFFLHFLVQCRPETGMVLKFVAKGSQFCRIQLLRRPVEFLALRECQVIARQSDNILADLSWAGVIKGIERGGLLE